MAELVAENPLRAGLRLSDVPGPCALVIFGGSGDLAHRKLVPALYNLALRGLLPAGFGVVGIGRSDYGGDDGFRASMKESVAKYSRTQPLDETVWESFAEGLCYVRGAFDEAELYRDLGDAARPARPRSAAPPATPSSTSRRRRRRSRRSSAGLGDSKLSHEENGGSAAS